MIVEVHRGRVARLVLLAHGAWRETVYVEVVMRDGGESDWFHILNTWLAGWVRESPSPLPEKVVLDVLSLRMPRVFWRQLMRLLEREDASV